MSDPAETVRDFIAAFNANDLERILGFFHPDAVYHNVPVQPVQGLDAIRSVLQGFLGLATEVDWVLHHLATDASGVVLTERLDRFRIQGRWVELPVMGAFELEDGRIRAWRDDFDMKQFQSQLPGAG